MTVASLAAGAIGQFFLRHPFRENFRFENEPRTK